MVGSMDAAKLQSIHISEQQRRRSNSSFWVILFLVAFAVARPSTSRDLGQGYAG